MTARWVAGLLSALLAGGAWAEPPFSDTAGTVFDIITETDPSAFACLVGQGREDRQIWDKRVDGEPVVKAWLFKAHYSDGLSITLQINPEFDDRSTEVAQRFATALGRLPTEVRRGIGRFSVHAGDEGFHAGVGQIVVYEGRADHRASYAHLEESLFHEAVHATWGADHDGSTGWRAAQAADGGFLTDYAAENPLNEDLAETALFAFAILHHPDRFPPADTEATLQAVPARIAYVGQHLLPPGAPLLDLTGTPAACAGG